MKLSKGLAAAVQRRWGKLMDRIRGIGGQEAVNQWWKSNSTNIITEAKRYRWIILLMAIPFLLSAQPKTGFVQAYSGDNQSQIVLAISSNRLFLQSLAPGDPIMSFRILTHVQDEEENFLRVQAKDGELHTVICNRLNAVFTSEWGNTWYWNLPLPEEEPVIDSIELQPQTRGYLPDEEPCELLDFGPTRDGSWVHIYPTHVDISLPGREPHLSLIITEIGSSPVSGAVTAYWMAPDGLELVAFGGEFPAYYIP